MGGLFNNPENSLAAPPTFFPAKKVVDRVTKFGAFSPFGRLFDLGRCFGNHRSRPTGVLHFSTVAVNVNLDKKYFGLHFGPFFHELIRSPWLWIAILLFRFDFSASLRRGGGERRGEREGD
jgi:hypothetical protein